MKEYIAMKKIHEQINPNFSQHRERTQKELQLWHFKGEYVCHRADKTCGFTTFMQPQHSMCRLLSNTAPVQLTGAHAQFWSADDVSQSHGFIFHSILDYAGINLATCLYYDSVTWKANHVNSGWWFDWDARRKLIWQWPWYTRERRDCTCLSGKHWQFIVTLVDGYIPVCYRLWSTHAWKTRNHRDIIENRDICLTIYCGRKIIDITQA